MNLLQPDLYWSAFEKMRIDLVRNDIIFTFAETTENLYSQWHHSLITRNLE